MSARPIQSCVHSRMLSAVLCQARMPVGVIACALLAPSGGCRLTRTAAQGEVGLQQSKILLDAEQAPHTLAAKPLSCKCATLSEAMTKVL